MYRMISKISSLKQGSPDLANFPLHLPAFFSRLDECFLALVAQHGEGCRAVGPEDQRESLGNDIIYLVAVFIISGGLELVALPAANDAFLNAAVPGSAVVSRLDLAALAFAVLELAAVAAKQAACRNVCIRLGIRKHLRGLVPL